MPITLEVADKLIANGLQGISKQELSNILNSISYYRLRGYIYPYFHSYKNNKTIKNNITWETIWNDYNFDPELKGLLFQEIGKIKIALKTVLINVFSLKYGQTWYINSELYYDSTHYENDKNELFHHWDRSSEKFKQHFKNKYQGNSTSWMIFKTSSFGNGSKIFENIKNCYTKQLMTEYFGFRKNSEKVLISWLRHLVYLRNIIAHHGLLFSKIFITVPRLSKDKFNNIDIIPNKLFVSIVIIAYLLKQTGYTNKEFISKLIKLLNKYPTVDISLMGFPINWQEILLNYDI